MKNKLFLLYWGICLFFTACKEEVPFEPVLSVSPSILSVFESNGGEQELVIQTNLEWIASSSSDWVVINPSSGDEEIQSVLVSVLPNETYDSRDGMIVFRNSKYNVADTVHVSQVQKDAIILAQNVYEISYVGGELKFKVSSNVDFTITTPSWIQRAESKGLTEKEVVFNVDENEELESRKGVVTFAYGDIEQNVEVIQGGYEDTIERNALIAFYKATDGDNWKNNTNWCTDKPLDDWYGINVNEKRRVVNIYIDDNNLRGTLPAELGNLSSLRSLEINRNKELSGPIPKELGNLSNLEHLVFYISGLNGSIPKELGNLSKLRVLGIDNSKLSGSIPTELGNLTCLEELNLSQNDLSGSIPSTLGNLSKLERLDLSFTALTGPIPKELGNLSNLKTLCLYYIGYKGGLTGEIPKELGNLSKLENLWLNGNDLSGSIPPELGNLTCLKSLTLGANDLSGTIPVELGFLKNLTHLRLEGNELTGVVPIELGNLTMLESFSLYKNQLSGPIPEFISQMDSYATVWLYDNQFSGNLPEKVVNHKDWDCWWPHIVSGTDVDMKNVLINAPEFEVVDMNGNQINSDELYSKNKVTIIFEWEWLGSSKSYIKTLNGLYQSYHSKGLEILSCNYGEMNVYGATTQEVNDYIQQNMSWNNFVWRITDQSTGASENDIELFRISIKGVPKLIVVDNNKQIIFQNYTEDENDLSAFLSDYFNE